MDLSGTLMEFTLGLYHRINGLSKLECALKRPLQDTQGLTVTSIHISVSFGVATLLLDYQLMEYIDGLEFLRRPSSDSLSRWEGKALSLDPGLCTRYGLLPRS